MLCDLVGLIVILTWLLLYETYGELLLKKKEFDLGSILSIFLMGHSSVKIPVMNV